MISSFYKDGRFMIGLDESHHPDILFTRDINIDEKTQKIEFDVETQEVKVVDIPGAKRMIAFHNILKGETNDLQGYEFSDIEIGDIITARVFDGNPYTQMVLQVKATESMFRKIAGQNTPEDDAVLAKKDQVMAAVNEIRALFSLSPI